MRADRTDSASDFDPFQRRKPDVPSRDKIGFESFHAPNASIRRRLQAITWYEGFSRSTEVT